MPSPREPQPTITFPAPETPGDPTIAFNTFFFRVNGLWVGRAYQPVGMRCAPRVLGQLTLPPFDVEPDCRHLEPGMANNASYAWVESEATAAGLRVAEFTSLTGNSAGNFYSSAAAAFVLAH